MLTWMGRLGLVSALLALALGACPAAASAAGRIFQLSGALGCASERGGENCAPGRGLAGASAVAVSANGRNVYVASNDASTLTTFRRNPRTGTVAQLSGDEGCLAQIVRAGCGQARGLFGAFAVTLSPNGRNVYVASLRSVAVFARDRTTGVLTQLPGADGCMSEDSAEGCANARGLAGVASIAVPADGRNVYTAAVGSSAVAVFTRDPDTGALGQLAGIDGCVSEGGAEGCATGRGLDGAFSVAVSPSGTEVYATASRSNAVAVLARDADTGALGQLAGANGCLSAAGTEGCSTARGIRGANGIAVSPDGRNVYTASSSSNAVATFGRGSDGRLSQLGGARGCTSEGGAERCATGHALNGAFGIAVSSDENNVYVASGNALVAFQRSAGDGVLTEIEGPAGCVSQGGSDRCGVGRALLEPAGVAVSADGSNAYVASIRSDSLAVFARDPRRGFLAVAMRGLPRPCARRNFRVLVSVRTTLPLRRVRVFLDGRGIGTSDAARLIVRVRPARLGAGRHRLLVDAADVTGTHVRRAARFARCRN